MAFVDNFKKAFEMVTLKDEAYQSVAKDSSATGAAILFVVLAGMLGSVMTLSVGSIIGAGVVSLVLSFITTGVVFLFGMMFGGKGGYMDLYRVMGVGSLVKALAFIPYAGGLVWLYYYFVMGVKGLKAAMNLTTGKAVGALLIPFLVLLGLVIVAVVMMGAAILSMAGAAGGLGGLEGFTGNFIK